MIRAACRLAAGLRLGVGLTAAGLLGACAATQYGLDKVAGHDRAGPPRAFAFQLDDVFLLPSGGVLLSGRDRSTDGAEPWVVELKPGSATLASRASLTGASNRLEIPWKEWHRPFVPIQPAVLAADPGAADAAPTAEDVAACSFSGAMQRRAGRLRVLQAWENLAPGTPVLTPISDRIRPAGLPLTADPQIVMTNLAPGLLEPLPGSDRHVEVAFLAEVRRANPLAALQLPFYLGVDAGAALTAPLRTLLVRPPAAPNSSPRLEQLRTFGREHACSCVVGADQPNAAPSCYEPRW